MNYDQSIGSWGDLSFKTSWTKNLANEQQTHPTDPVIDLLDAGYYSRDPIWRGNASLAWSKGDWNTTLYANIIGPTADYEAWTDITNCSRAAATKRVRTRPTTPA